LENRSVFAEFTGKSTLFDAHGRHEAIAMEMDAIAHFLANIYLEGNIGSQKVSNK